MNNNFYRNNRKEKNNKIEWLKSFAIAIIISFFIKFLIFDVTYVKGDSMNPTLEEGDRLILKKYGTVLDIEEYDRGDIVIFPSPLENDRRLFIKRIIGLPGDKIDIIDGQIYINDEYVFEPYIQKHSFTQSIIFGNNYIVPKNHIFVIGDNRTNRGSFDSRHFGSVPIEKVKGKIIFRVFPFSKAGSF